MTEVNWEEHWQEQHTPWDVGTPSPNLIAVANDLPGGNVLVPGCGAGHDVFALKRPDRKIIGLDLAPTAKETFEKIRTEKQIPESQAKFVCGDYFATIPEEGSPEEGITQNTFDLIWDYTFLCALPPSMRQTWAQRTAELLKPGGTLAMLIFPVDPKKEGGPPYAVDPTEINNLLTSHFDQETLTPAKKSIPSRQGKEWLGIFKRSVD